MLEIYVNYRQRRPDVLNLKMIGHDSFVQNDTSLTFMVPSYAMTLEADKEQAWQGSII